ncbi:MAG: C1 family peptidase, partial [Carnobacterium alterfunditum]
DTMEKLNMESFEFSQNYTLFWDKLEKSNYFLDSILETLDEAQDSRIISHLLTDPVQDGGQWDMFSGLLEKYGAVPKSVMPETFHSSNTSKLNEVLTSKLREFACQLREGHHAGSSLDESTAKKESMLYFIYSVLVKALGEVPETFDYSYRTKDGEYCRIKDTTPQAFFKEYVGWDLTNLVSLLNAPTEDKPFGRAYTVKYLGTVKEAKPIQYINVPIQALKEAAVASIKDDQPVWFGCDVGKMLIKDAGIMDEHSYHYELTLGEGSDLTKAQRLDYGDSLLTHAMVFVGVDLDEQGQPLTWKVENSWGDKVGKKGIYSMSDKWFEEFNYQIAVDKKYVSEKWLKALEKPTIELEPWDPMGALALVK